MRRLSKLCLLCLLTIHAAAALGALYHSNRAPLQDTPFIALPLGSVEARGWLLKQLELQRDGLTGHFEELAAAIPEGTEYLAGGANSRSGWLGGTGERWERSPSYLRGLVALAWTLDDNALKAKAMKWIDWVLGSQKASGDFGPPRVYAAWWPRMLMMEVLLDYYEVTGDARVVPFLTKYTKFQLRTLRGNPLTIWARYRGADNLHAVVRLYNLTGERYLLDLMELLKDQTEPWIDWFDGTRADYHDARGSHRHGVNLAHGFKLPAVYYQKSGVAAHRDAFYAGERLLMGRNGQIVGLPAADELVAGKGSTRGVETCSVVESMRTYEIAMRIFGDAALGDTLEKIAFNSLAANYAKDIKARTYFQAPNQIQAVRGDYGFRTPHFDATMPGPITAFPCCAHAHHMGWPKFVMNMWSATPDAGLAVMAYGPSRVTARVDDGRTVTITETTDYPFGETVRFVVDASAPATFPLKLRIPAWSGRSTIAVNGAARTGVMPGTFHVIDRTWSDGDVVTVRFPMDVRTSTWINGALGIEHGPLVYSLALQETWTPTSRIFPVAGFRQCEVTTSSPWNYALDVNLRQPADSLTVQRRSMPANPFDPALTPVTMTAKARRLPSWTKTGLVASEPPSSPVRSSQPKQSVTLVPFGATSIRVTYFPVLDETRPTVATFFDHFDDGNDAGWHHYGGRWRAADGRYSVDAGPGHRSVLADQEFADFHLSVRVRKPSPGGNVGVVFRSDGHGLGADAYRGYYVGLADWVVVLGRAGDRWQELSQAPLNSRAPGLARNDWHTLTVQAKGDAINVYVDGNLLITHNDAAFGSGRIGLRVWDANAEFDDLLVWQGGAFRDEFATENTAVWAEHGGDWTVADGAYRIARGPGDKVVARGLQVADFRLQADVAVGAAGNAGVILRATNPGTGADAYNGYYVGISAANDAVEIGRANGTWTPLASTGMTIDADTAYRVKVEMRGSSIKAYVGDMATPKLDIRDSAFGHGSVGLRTWWADAKFDNLEVTALP